MAYSNQTTNYGLPLPTGSDKSSWLDTNEGFQRIDTALKGAVEGISGVVTSVEGLAQTVSELATSVSTVTGDVQTAHMEIVALQTLTTTLNNQINGTSGVVNALAETNEELGQVVDVIDEFISGHTPQSTIITSSSFGHTATIKHNDYFYQIMGEVNLQTGSTIPLEHLANGRYYLVLYNLTANQTSEIFPHLEKNTDYEALKVYGFKPAGTLPSYSTIATVYLYINNDGSSIIYTNLATNTEQSITLSVGTTLSFSIGGAQLKTLSATVPQPL